jgi:hypothetical protein
MGRLINGPNGPFIGKAGSYIGYTINGVGYIKGIYKKRTKPPAEKEALCQKKFALAQRWLRAIIPFVKVGFKGYNERFQGFVAAKSYLMKNAIRVEEGEIIIDPALVRISSGTLAMPEELSVKQEEPAAFRITWKASGSVDRYDQLMFLAYDIDQLHADGIVYGNARHTGEQLVKVRQGRAYHVYAAFIADDRSRQSDSVYLGKFEF